MTKMNQHSTNPFLTGGPAFPSRFHNDSDTLKTAPDGQVVQPLEGVNMMGATLRDLFTAHALTGLCARPGGLADPGQLADMAVQIADAAVGRRVRIGKRPNETEATAPQRPTESQAVEVLHKVASLLGLTAGANVARDTLPKLHSLLAAHGQLRENAREFKRDRDHLHTRLGELQRETGPMHSQLARAVRALDRAGFKDRGGEDWEPPLGSADGAAQSASTAGSTADQATQGGDPDLFGGMDCFTVEVGDDGRIMSVKPATDPGAEIPPHVLKMLRDVAAETLATWPNEAPKAQRACQAELVPPHIRPLLQHLANQVRHKPGRNLAECLVCNYTGDPKNLLHSDDCVVGRAQRLLDEQAMLTEQAGK